ncbi:MAG: NAD(P)H-dependent oxidoreductase subunit E [Proteobacteria bacterium]|nr:NAD(P)H-dependent oxidoreductase subunit E [Pseudomonadota bacterium]
MLDIKVCVGSSCHIKGSQAIVQMLQDAIAENHLEDKITLSGSFCTGNCNRIGVTIIVDEKTFTGVIPETFNDFFRVNVLSRVSH